MSFENALPESVLCSSLANTVDEITGQTANVVTVELDKVALTREVDVCRQWTTAVKATIPAMK